MLILSKADEKESNNTDLFRLFYSALKYINCSVHLICIACFKNIFLQMNYREVAITKGTNHFITGAEGGLVFLLNKNNYIQVSLSKYFILLYIKKI